MDVIVFTLDVSFLLLRSFLAYTNLSLHRIKTPYPLYSCSDDASKIADPSFFHITALVGNAAI